MENIQHKAFKTQIDKNTEGKISAYVSVYGNVDSANEICDYGCFAESLANKFPVMCLYHNWEMPIGKVIIAEEIGAGDDRLPEELKEFGGLYIEAQLNLDKQIAKEAWSDIKMGVLSEYSIGYVVLKDRIDEEGYRHLTKLDLIECSPVVRGANPLTKTLNVKAQIIEFKDTFKPTEGMKEQAQMALDWKAEGIRGGTRIGLTRANQIVNGDNLSEDTVKRMYSYFSRHEVDKQGQGFERGEDGYPSPGRVAWGLWGGDPGFTFSAAIVERLKREEEDKKYRRRRRRRLKSQINTKQMKEILNQIQEHLAAVMSPIDELKALLASAQILEDEGIAEPLAQMEEPLVAALGFLEELTLNLAELGYLDAVAPVATEPEPAQADDTEQTEVKALDLPVVLEALTQIITIAEAVVGFDLEVVNADMKSVDEIMTSIASLQSVVQTEIDTPTGEVDLQAMVDAFTIVNTNVDELIAEAQVIDLETNPEVADYIVNLEQIKAISTELMETVMAEMEALVQAAPEETADGTKAVARRISLDEQIELEQLFSRVLQSQFNINQ